MDRLAAETARPILAGMTSAVTAPLLSIDDYLRTEADGTVRHEYIGGRTYAMAGGSERHNLIAGNLFAAFHAHLRGGSCKAYMADFIVRLEINREDVFYYPDVMVACQRVGVEPYYLRYPTLLVEVLSPSTEAIDRREKLLNYPQIPTVEEYVLVVQDSWDVTIQRRAEHWVPQLVATREATAEFRSIALSVPIAQVYEGVCNCRVSAANPQLHGAMGGTSTDNIFVRLENSACGRNLAPWTRKSSPTRSPPTSRKRPFRWFAPICTAAMLEPRRGPIAMWTLPSCSRKASTRLSSALRQPCGGLSSACFGVRLI
jgi:Uma2 family endonuclease